MKIIIEYIKDRKNRKIGLVSAAYSIADNKVLIGFSLCNTKRDKFKKDLAYDIARKRMTKYKNKKFYEIEIPSSIKKKLIEFIPRIKLYYKDKEFVDWIYFVNEYLLEKYK